jgi:hypothetical protein
VSTPLRERPDAPLGTLIFRAGLLPAETIESALEEGVKTGKRLGEILTERGLISEVDLARLLAGQKGLEFVTLREQIVDPTAAALFTEEQARLFRALPYSFDGELPIVAIADPTDDVLIRNIREALGREDARFVVTARGELAEISADVYANSPQTAPATAPAPPVEAAQANGHAEVVLEPPVAAEHEPQTAEPELSEPASPEPEAVAPEPAAVQPEPVVAEPEPATVDPDLSEPFAAEPEPATVDPDLSEPFAAEPALPEPHAAEPAPPEPVAASEPPLAPEPPAAPAAPEAEAAAEPQPVDVPVPAPPPASPEASAQPEPAPLSDLPAEPEPLRVTEASAPPEPAATETPDAVGPEAAAAEPIPFPQPAPPAPEPPYPPAASGPAPVPAPVVEPVAAPLPPAEEAPAATPWRMTIRLTNGERVEAGEFADETSAKQEAKTIMMQIAAADTDDWPFVNGRFLKPDTIVSVDIAESDGSDS